MADARTTILERIRASFGSESRGEPDARYAQIPRPYLRAGKLEPDALFSLFKDRLKDYDANVVEASAGEEAAAIDGILRSHGQQHVVLADGLPVQLIPGEGNPVPELQADRELLNACDGIVTTCAVAIAASGTIVLTHQAGQGRRQLSLIPDRHLCVVRADQVVETLPEAFERLRPFSSLPMTFISGPSATADIEMTRIRGVHGPRHLDVLFVK